MDQDVILKEIIKGYRNSIQLRYQYDKIKEVYDIPNTIGEGIIIQLRDFFLEYMYPPYEKRTELNDAFKSLDDYIKNPQKLVRIVLDAARLFFRYGRYLPKILSAGLNAMKTFKAATTFENRLVSVAIKNQISPPYSLININELISCLSRPEIEEFIDSSQVLFELLHDRGLVKKIQEVIEHLIRTMKKNKKSYTMSQVKGLEIGLQMIQIGDELFNQLSKEDQHILIDTIKRIEKDNLNTIFIHVD